MDNRDNIMSEPTKIVDSPLLSSLGSPSVNELELDP